MGALRHGHGISLWPLVAAGAAVALLITALAAGTPEIARAAGNAVTLEDFAYAPASITITVGDTVTWTNNDPVEHTVTSAADPSGSTFDLVVAPGASVSFTFTAPGTFDYFCRPHPDMHGTVVVRAASPGASPLPDVAVPPPTGRGAPTALGVALLALATTGAAWRVVSGRLTGG